MKWIRSQTRKVIAKDADLAMIQCFDNHSLCLSVWKNAENNTVEKGKKKKKSEQFSDAEAVSSLHRVQKKKKVI